MKKISQLKYLNRPTANLIRSNYFKFNVSTHTSYTITQIIIVDRLSKKKKKFFLINIQKKKNNKMKITT